MNGHAKYFNFYTRNLQNRVIVKFYFFILFICLFIYFFYDDGVFAVAAKPSALILPEELKGG